MCGQTKIYTVMADSQSRCCIFICFLFLGLRALWKRREMKRSLLGSVFETTPLRFSRASASGLRIRTPFPTLTARTSFFGALAAQLLSNYSRTIPSESLIHLHLVLCLPLHRFPDPGIVIVCAASTLVFPAEFFSHHFCLGFGIDAVGLRYRRHALDRCGVVAREQV